VFVGNYRIIFRVGKDEILVLGVVHGARLLADDQLDDSTS
jgi:hypothetical protein